MTKIYVNFTKNNKNNVIYLIKLQNYSKLFHTILQNKKEENRRDKENSLQIEISQIFYKKFYFILEENRRFTKNIEFLRKENVIYDTKI